MKVILNINENISYSGMVRDRNRLIAIMSEEKYWAWYLQNFLSLIMYDNMNIHCYDTVHSYEIFDIYNQVIDINRISLKDMTIENIEKYIELGNYIIVCCDQYYMHDSIYFQKEHFFGEMLIYGFDSYSKEFFFHASQLKRKDYAVSVCNYEDFLMSIRGSNYYSTNKESKVWQVNFGHPFSRLKLKDVNIEFDINKVYYKLCALLDGGVWSVEADNHITTYKIGKCVFDGINELWITVKNNPGQNYIRAIWCIKLLSGYIKNYKNVVEYIKTNYIMDFGQISEIYDLCDSLSERLVGIYVLMHKFLVTRKVNENVLLEQIDLAKSQFIDIIKIIVYQIDIYLFEERE